jgi:hypothetical protein
MSFITHNVMRLVEEKVWPMRIKDYREDIDPTSAAIRGSYQNA